MPPPVGTSIGGGELNIRVKGLDLIRGRIGNGSGGGEKDGLVRGRHVGPHVDKMGGGGRVDGRASSSRGGDSGDATDRTRGAGRSGNREGVFADMRVLIGSSTPSRNQVAKWITEMGGSVLSPMDYKLCTHICLDGEDADIGEAYVWHRDNKKVISKTWIKQAYDTKIMPENDEVPFRSDCLNQIDAGPRANFTAGRVKRTLCFDEKEEDMFMRNHQLFLCRADTSARTSLTVYVQAIQQTLVNTIMTPGSFPQHLSSTTNPDIKATIKEVYILIKSLNRAGYSLCGQFTTDNFVIDKGKGQINIRFSGLHTEAFKKSDPESQYLDILGFKKMVRRQIFMSMIVPHDMNLWLSLIGKEECEHIIPHHIYLLDYKDWTEPFMTWYDTWKNLKDTDNEKYSGILVDLNAYDGWKTVVEGDEKNTFLEDTLKFVDPHSQMKVDYPDDAYGLIHLMRNCRHHQAIEYLQFFALITSQFFPNLISDFQLAMVKAGCIKLPA